MSFKNLVGQNELRSLLFSALTENKLSHSVLLTGPSGSGKKSWGRALSMAVLCSCRVAGEPCMECISCRSFLNGNHPDFFELSPDGRNIKIDQIRSLRQKFYLQGSKKVCMINQAEVMTAEASSSLLKLLEDPPDDLHFILLARQPRLLFDTIVSRCQRYVLKPLDCSDITRLLLDKKQLSEEKASLVARISGGLPGYAFELADDEHFEGRFEEVKTLAYNLATGCDSAQQLLSWARYLSDREDLTNFLELLGMIYRDGMIQNLCVEKSMNWFADIDSVSLEDSVMLINSVIYELNNTNVNRRLLLEKLLVLLQRRFSKCQKSSGFGSSRLEKPIILNPV